MSKRVPILLGLIAFATTSAFAQGLETSAKSDDWEEINFEFDSDILSDGYPSLLRLADLLNKNGDYTVELVGHTDFRGSDQYNVGLGRRRSDTVKAFLLKYGAREGQITIETQGESTPKVPNETDEGRFMNRRVTMTAKDGDGKLVSDGSVGDAINGIEKLIAAQEDCCNQILEKLSKLDDIIDLLGGLKAENDRLRADVDALKGDIAKAATPAQVEAVARNIPTTTEIADEVDKRIPKIGNKYTTVNANMGPSDPSGNISGTVSARTFVPFGGRHAVQAQGEYLHYFDRDEGQFDLGLVSRFGDVQLGGFSSFKHVKFDDFQRGGTIGQGAFTLDYLFNKGRVGFFGTKALVDDAIVNVARIRPNTLEETYLSVVDQVGFSTAVAAWGDSWFEGNLGALFREGGGNKPGGTIRYIHPFTKGVALTLEAGVNETLVTNNNDARFVVGIQVGNWLSPKKYKDNGKKPVPVDVPRVRYEVLTRQVRDGNSAPVADAGPDMVGIEPGLVTLDGSGSFDQDGDDITFEWTQIGGTTVALTGADQAVASFTSEEGETYHFRLTVRDQPSVGQPLMATDRVTVSASDPIMIKRFRADRTQIKPGETVTVSWETVGADSVELVATPSVPGLGSVGTSGAQTVPLQETTQFTLTARSGNRTFSDNITVEVTPNPEPVITEFTATPLTINEGDQTVLQWMTVNADSVTVTVQNPSGSSGLGSVGTSGSATVSPRETTTYLLTATNVDGRMVSRTITVAVVPPDAPRILRFLATPQEILPGDFSSLSWVVENADTVSITGVSANLSPQDGNADVNPEETTEYTLTATNDVGSVTAVVIVTVLKAPRILTFESNKVAVKNSNEPAVLSWTTENADRVVLVNFGEVEPNGSMTVNPVGQTIYTLIAYGKQEEVTSTVIIGVENPNRSPNAVAEAPWVILVPAGTLTGQGQLDGSKSSDPDGDNLTFEWRALGPLNATIENPSATMPTVTFLGGYGEYNFELMVTDPDGAMAFDTVKVFWVDP